MPFKRNPVMSENIDSLARLLPAFADVAWQNAATNLLERTIDDNGNRRTILPEALLCADQILRTAVASSKGCASTSARSPRTCAPTVRSRAAKRC